MEFLAEENALLREKIRNITQKIQDAGGCDAKDDYSKGWDKAITEALHIIETETGVTIDEILHPKCN